jgi:hypothetical protein
MKNIHIIPTDESLKKRGDLVQDKFGTIHIFTINDGEEYGKTTTKLHIYITSNEEINEGDWVLTPTNDVLQWAKVFRPIGEKIIFTTHPTLIRYGVQKIPIVFLEWFVKNPSCEFVEVERKHPVMIGTPNRLEGNYDYRCYKCGVVENMIGSKCDTICYKCLVYKIVIPEEPKQDETGKWFADNADLKIIMERPNEERYSEDEVRELIIKALTHDDYMFCGSLVTKDNEIRTANFNIWFEEYKKK